MKRPSHLDRAVPRFLATAGIGLALSFYSILGTASAKASDVMVGVRCMQMGYTVIDPIYMGRTVSGYAQWACASSSGINLKGPPFPVMICDSIGRCNHAGWTY